MDLLATRGGSVFSVPTMQQGSMSHIHIAGDVLVICTPLDTSWIWFIHLKWTDEPMKKTTKSTNQSYQWTNKQIKPWSFMAFWNPYPPLLWSSENRSATADASGEGLSKASSRCTSRILRIDGLSSSAWGRLVGGPNHPPVPPVKWKRGYNHPEKIGRRWKRLCRYGRSAVVGKVIKVTRHLDKLENVLWWCWGPAFRWKRSPLSTAECVYGVILAVEDRQRTTWNCRRLGVVIRDGCWRKPLWHLFVGVSHLIFVVIQIYTEILMIWQLPAFLKDQCDTFTRFL